MSYPAKLRELALQALLRGHTKAEVNEIFGLGVNTLRDWEKLEAETGSLENRPLNRGAYKPKSLITSTRNSLVFK